MSKRALFLFAIIFLVFAVPTFLFGSYYYQKISTEMTMEVFTKRATVASLSASALRNKLNHLVKVAQSLAADPVLQYSVRAGDWASAIGRVDDMSNEVDYYDPFVDRIVLVDRAGVVQAANPRLYGGVGQKSAIYDEWAPAIYNEKKPFYVSNVYTRIATPRINVISVVAPVQSGGAILGAISLQVPINTFSDFGKDIDLGSDGFAYFVDRKGHIVAHPKYSSQGPVIDYSSLGAVQRAIRGESGSEISYNPLTRVERALVYAPVPEFGWGVIAQESTQNAFGQRDDILFRIIISLMTLFILEAAISLVIALKRPSYLFSITKNHV